MVVNTYRYVGDCVPKQVMKKILYESPSRLKYPFFIINFFFFFIYSHRTQILNILTIFFKPADELIFLRNI